MTKSTHEEVQKSGETLFLYLYGDKTGRNSLNEYRCNVFKQSLKKNKAKLEALPPTKDADKYHSFRVYQQVQSWLGNNKSPSEWGWELKNGYDQLVRTKEEAAPNSILQLLSCGCNGDCLSARCTFHKAGIKCSTICKKCQGISCQNREDLGLQEIDLSSKNFDLPEDTETFMQALLDVESESIDTESEVSYKFN